MLKNSIYFHSFYCHCKTIFMLIKKKSTKERILRKTKGTIKMINDSSSAIYLTRNYVYICTECWGSRRRTNHTLLLPAAENRLLQAEKEWYTTSRDFSSMLDFYRIGSAFYTHTHRSTCGDTPPQGSPRF